MYRGSAHWLYFDLLVYASLYLVFALALLIAELFVQTMFSCLVQNTRLQWTSGVQRKLKNAFVFKFMFNMDS